MPLTLPPLPSFQANIPQMPDPLQTYGKVLQLRTLMGQQALLPVQLQQEQQKVETASLQNQRMQQELESEKALQRAVAGGVLNKYMGVDTADGSGFDAAGAYRDLVSNNGPILTDHASRMVNSMLEMAKNQAEIAKATGQAGEAQQNIRAKTLNQLADKLGSINDRPLEKASAALDALKQDLIWNPRAYPGLTQQEMGHLYGATLDHLPAVEQLLGLEGKIADYHKGQAEATAAQQKVIPQGAVMSPDTAQQVQKDIAVATNPLIQAGKEQVAAAEGRARANIEAQMLRGSNAAVAQVPPHLVAAATADATKAGTEFAQAQSVTQRLNAMMGAARQGNVVAYQVIPEEGTLQITTSQGVHRINRTEIEQYAGGGSAWDRLVGHVGKQLTGASIPSNVLDDMEKIQQIQADGAKAKYENSLKVINQSYGSTFKPVDIGQNKPATAAPTPQSHDFSISAWQRANPGGNVAAARATAAQQGYNVVP
jgi:hypothetical protein